MIKAALTIIMATFLGCQYMNVDQLNIYENLNFAEHQIILLLEEAYEAERIPRTVSVDGSIHWMDIQKKIFIRMLLRS